MYKSPVCEGMDQGANIALNRFTFTKYFILKTLFFSSPQKKFKYIFYLKFKLTVECEHVW